ncbi:hypothetical protein L1987_18784 [Smallanthus sonchifolius]|uniref:Uncharacterized protein n=1 Tax=Smallanthus sonchifolius TaxID=185202 RepID=A0ACB9J111_9ASTR|nr:hypothetical protein L1987_18784 [Smallanthus sonchifolius]
MSNDTSSMTLSANARAGSSSYNPSNAALVAPMISGGSVLGTNASSMMKNAPGSECYSFPVHVSSDEKDNMIKELLINKKDVISNLFNLPSSPISQESISNPEEDYQVDFVPFSTRLTTRVVDPVIPPLNKQESSPRSEVTLHNQNEDSWDVHLDETISNNRTIVSPVQDDTNDPSTSHSIDVDDVSISQPNTFIIIFQIYLLTRKFSRARILGS